VVFGGERQNHPVATDAEPAITQPLNPLGRQRKRSFVGQRPAGIHHQKIVAETLVFAEMEHGRAALD
jgi:hypothetical protein